MLACIRDEEIADLEAFQRQYDDDQSWTALQEDEYGRLRPLVRSFFYSGSLQSCEACMVHSLTAYLTLLSLLLEIATGDSACHPLCLQ